MQQRERHHRERRDHEVDPGAGLLDQKHTFRREVAFARDRRKSDTRDRAYELRCGRQDPRQRFGAGVGVMALERIGDQHHNRQHRELGLHPSTPLEASLRGQSTHTQQMHETEQRDGDRDHPNQLGLGPARHADGVV